MPNQNGVFSTYTRDGHTIAFRLPRWEDRAAFQAVLNELHDESLRAPLWVPTRRYDDAAAADKLFQVLKKIDFGRGVFLFAEVDGELVGHGWVDYMRGNFGEGYATIAIELVERGRGLGIGKRLLLAMEELARQAGVRALYLTVSSKNAAMQLYASLGYEEVGRKKHYFGSNFGQEPFEDRADLVDMVKWL